MSVIFGLTVVLITGIMVGLSAKVIVGLLFFCYLLTIGCHWR